MSFVHPRAARLRDRHWSDWVGFICYLAFAVFILAGSRAMGIFLLPTVMHEVLVAISFLLRNSPKGRSMRWYAQFVAYGSTWSFPVFITVAQLFSPEWVLIAPDAGLRVLGNGIWLLGLLFGLWPVWCLRHSFSIEPQARELVTNGPYSVARHPIYTSYILQYGGFVLARPTVALIRLYVGWFILMFIRARCEEQVLRSAFPTYDAYRHRIGMFGPKIVQRNSESQQRG